MKIIGMSEYLGLIYPKNEKIGTLKIDTVSVLKIEHTGFIGSNASKR